MEVLDAASSGGALTWWGGWLPAFVLTCVIEVPVYLLMFDLFGLVGSSPSQPPSRSLSRAGLGWGRAAVLALGLNAVSHPVFWAFALGFDGVVDLLVGELAVVAVEAMIVWLVVRKRPIACAASAVVANAASAVLGSAVLRLVTSWAS